MADTVIGNRLYGTDQIATISCRRWKENMKTEQALFFFTVKWKIREDGEVVSCKTVLTARCITCDFCAVLCTCCTGAIFIKFAKWGTIYIPPLMVILPCVSDSLSLCCWRTETRDTKTRTAPPPPPYIEHI